MGTYNKIKFSHTYDKMPFNIDGETLITEGILIAVFKTTKAELGKRFIEYDTHWYSEKEGGYYPLPDGELLVLLLMTHDADGSPELMTTIRSRYGKMGDKFPYYQSKIDQMFEFIIEDVGKARE